MFLLLSNFYARDSLHWVWINKHLLMLSHTGICRSALLGMCSDVHGNRVLLVYKSSLLVLEVKADSSVQSCTLGLHRKGLQGGLEHMSIRGGHQWPLHWTEDGSPETCFPAGCNRNKWDITSDGFKKKECEMDLKIEAATFFFREERMGTSSGPDAPGGKAKTV